MVPPPVRYASPNAHFLVGDMPAPQTMSGRWRDGAGLSIAAHAAVFGLLLYGAARVTQVADPGALAATRLKVFLDRPGAAGGDDSGGPDTNQAPHQVEANPRLTPHFSPVTNPADTASEPAAQVPVMTAQPVDALPGAPAAFDSTAPGVGHGSGSGPGGRPGPGQAGPGGPGGDARFPGDGVTSPQLIKEIRPNYTGNAMRAKLQGVVEMQALVLPDGSVDPSKVRITRSLDTTFGLDEQAIAAVKQWRFRPGTLKGEPVAVWVTVELTFTLR